jgi:hypothetical protein
MSGGGGTDSTTTATTQNYSPEEAAQRAKVQGEAARIYNATAPTISSASYPGAQVTPFSAETIAAQNLAVQNAGEQQTGVGLMNQGLNYGLSGAMDVQNNPYLQSAISAALRPVTQSYVDPGGVLSSIRTNATEAGQFGGIRQGMAEGIAAGRYSQNAMDMASGMANDAYKTGQDTFSRTLALAPQTLQAANIPVNTLSGVGSQKENLGQEQANYDANARMWGLNAPWAPLQNYASIVYGGANPSTTSTSEGPAQSSGGVRGALGGAASGALTGMAVPGVGPLIGAGLGGLAGLLK